MTENKKFPQPCVFCGSSQVVVADDRFGHPAYGEKLWQCKACGSRMDERSWDKSVKRNEKRFADKTAEW